MPLQKSILIGCPQHRRLMRGSYGADESGECRMGPDGSYLLEFVRCSQDDGRCMQTLCVLHRFNRRGPGAWYPYTVVAAREPRRSGAAGREKTGSGSVRQPDDGREQGDRGGLYA